MIKINLSTPAASGGSTLELRIKAPAALEVTPEPEIKIPTLVYIHDSIVPEQLPIITHALLDTINRVTWTNQINLLTSTHKLPEHLETRPIQGEELLKTAESLGPCNLVIFSNEKDQNFSRKISRASEFLTKTHLIQPTEIIETIDSLNDHIKNLKQKTIVNLKVEIELPKEDDTLETLNYIPKLTKVGNTYFANLIDLASEEEKAYAFKMQTGTCRVKYTYEDLVLVRNVHGGFVI